MRKLALILAIAIISGCAENKKESKPRCSYLLLVSYTNGEIDTSRYNADCNTDITQYHDEIWFNTSTVEYNTIRFKLISKTQIK